MKKPFQLFKFLVALSSIRERQLGNETKAAKLIMNELRGHSIKFSVQRFTTFVPKFISATLAADGKSIAAIPVSFTSGKIHSHDNMVSSLIDPDQITSTGNISFNPRCAGISRSSHYLTPSVAVSKKDIPTILRAKKTFGNVVVKKTKHESINILVGNTKNPTVVLFCHYDSFGPGACDNASGTAIMLDLIINNSLLESCLFVIAGNEELSYDQPVYWGHGYREFEKKYPAILKNVERILVLDSIGHAKTEIISDPKIVILGFPIKQLQKYISKTRMIAGGYDKLMEIYHSDLDTPDKLHIKYLHEAVGTTKKLIAKSSKN